MPTENRSSSKHATRTFTLDSLTDALEQVQALHEISADLIAESVFGQPAQQGKGEPAAWRGINDLGEVVTEWIDGVPPLSMTDLLGNPASFARIEQAYTYADPTQVARLELEIEKLRFSLTMNDCASVEDDCVRDENRELRAQLAEAQTLLRQANGLISLSVERLPKKHQAIREHAKQFRSSIESALSASAEPSAPAEIDELRAAVIARRDLDRRIQEMGIPPHMDYWDQVIFDADARIDAALEAKS